MEKISFVIKKCPGLKKPMGALVAVAVMLSVALCDPATVTKAVCDFQDESVALNASISPHTPANQCSALIASEVSWLEWVSGKSPSYQFHFFDLLELLYGKSDRDFQSTGK